MIERRLLGTGPCPTTHATEPHGGRRARLAAEGTDANAPAQAATDNHPAVPGRRTLDPSTTPDRN
ncbi:MULTISPECIES: hypothetical protein [unclassified Streptomyces]|uniref:hypothetical protein n=1 Tax=unclassified Streptomyces TaxID=2593676 RepID=UPI002E34CDD8|nr:MULTISPECIES: hypothetical protein [unclassified Streptomyces]WUC68972.1 hypothetical protein OG861_32430 [Streptomyces sp. NBC_00539]